MRTSQPWDPPDPLERAGWMLAGNWLGYCKPGLGGFPLEIKRFPLEIKGFPLEIK